MSTTVIITLLLIGLVAGMLSGLIGVGGGIILVPCLAYFMSSYTQAQAQGTSLGVLLFPVVILAFLTYFNKLKGTPNEIDFSVIAILAFGFVLGGLAGSNLAIRLDEKILKKIFAIVLFYTGIKMMGWDDRLIKFIKSF